MGPKGGGFKKKNALETFENAHRDIVERIGHNRTTSTSELNKVGTKLFGNEWLGAHPSDKIKKPPSRMARSFAIYNLDSTFDKFGARNSGTHWVAAYSERGEDGKHKVWFYDSYGRPKSEIMPHIDATDTDTSDSPYDQPKTGLGSEMCGQLSLAALVVGKELGAEGFEFM